jgi:hypothetical protein
MEYEQLKEEVLRIAEIAGSVPEQFRDKCFELLLNNLIGKQEHTRKGSASHSAPEEKTPDPKSEVDPPPASANTDTVSSVPMTTQLRLLMRKTTVSKAELDTVLMYDSAGDGAVHFVKEPHDVGVAAGQIEWALLIALKNAVLKDSLSVDPEDVRSVCQEKGFYDIANFAANFKRANYSKFFKGAMVSQGDAQQLSPDGQDALGKLIKRLASESQ